SARSASEHADEARKYTLRSRGAHAPASSVPIPERYFARPSEESSARSLQDVPLHTAPDLVDAMRNCRASNGTSRHAGTCLALPVLTVSGLNSSNGLVPLQQSPP